MKFKSIFTDDNSKIKNNSSSICIGCGRCCKTLGCFISPKDFRSYPNITREDLIEALNTGYVSIDWYESYQPEFFLRMRNMGAKIIDPSFGGVCCALTEDGCMFEFENRPYGGRELKPHEKEDESCESNYLKVEAKEEWRLFKDILYPLIDDYLDGVLKLNIDKEVDDYIMNSNVGDIDLFASIFRSMYK